MSLSLSIASYDVCTYCLNSSRCLDCLVSASVYLRPYMGYLFFDSMTHRYKEYAPGRGDLLQFQTLKWTLKKKKRLCFSSTHLCLSINIFIESLSVFFFVLIPNSVYLFTTFFCASFYSNYNVDFYKKCILKEM